MSVKRRQNFREFVLGLCYGKDETCTRAQIASYVATAINDLSDSVDLKLSRKSDEGHSHRKVDITDLGNVSASSDGLMTKALFNKLNGIATGANKTIVDDELNPNSLNPVQNKVICEEFYDKDDIINLLNNIQTGRGKLLSITVDEVTGDLVIDDDGFDYYTMDEVDENFTVSVEKQTNPDTGFLSTYVIKQGANVLSPKINIPRDFLVKSASVKTVTTVNKPVNGYSVGDKYIDFVVNAKEGTSSEEHLYLNVNDLVDIYTADESTLTLSNNQFKIKEVPVDKISGVLPENQVTHQSLDGKSDINHTHNSLNTQNIVSNSDLNDDMYKSQGIYLCESSSKAQSLSNCPVTNAFGMIVIQTYNTSNKSGFKQILMPYNVADSLNAIYTRNFFDTTWTDWRQIRDSYNSYSKNEVDTALNSKEDKSNKVTSWNSTVNDTHYPTEKLVHDSLLEKVDYEYASEHYSELGHGHNESDIEIDSNYHSSSFISDNTITTQQTFNEVVGTYLDNLESQKITLTATLENGTTKSFTIYGNENTGD